MGNQNSRKSVHSAGPAVSTNHKSLQVMSSSSSSGHHSSIRQKGSFRGTAASKGGTMTCDHRVIIKESWKEIKEWCAKNGNKTPGMCVFEKVIKLHPPLRTVFRMGPSQTLSVEENSLSPNLLHRHSHLFTNVLDLMVRNVEELDSQIAPALIIYGKRHFYKQNVGFALENLGVFIHAMVWTVYEVMGERAGQEVMEAWEMLVRYMIEKLKQGYQLEAMNRSGKLLRVFRKLPRDNVPKRR